jgi:hypothetical protein
MTEKSKLISRIVDREDRPEDWATLDDVLKRDSVGWRDLLFALRDDAEVRHAVGAHLAVADEVALPSGSAGVRNGWGMPAVLAATGWLAAVVLAVLWLGNTLFWGDPMAVEPALAADIIDPAAAGGADANVGVLAADGFLPDGFLPDGHLADGHLAEGVMGELPKLMVQMRQVAGREEIEVLYVRRTIERAFVKKAYTLKVDESGQPFTVPADLTAYIAAYTPPRSY